jgi:7,8-dihydropterin-6-yl-methyl-4-(beta-D-ribofuranosyl)aminobenzene 5'-phosphate synthase
MKITCTVDNAVDPHSSFWGEHGVAFLIESDGARVLFDTGASGTVLLHNLEAQDIALDSIVAVVLSHAHPDHTGGLPALLERVPGLPVYAHSDLGRERFSGRAQADAPHRFTYAEKAPLRFPYVRKGLPVDVDVLRQQADLHLSDAPQEVAPGIWTSGEISERPEPEGRSPHHVVREGERWVPDPYRDDMAVILEAPPGLVLVCGCCHAGLLNTLSHVRRVFERDPVVIIGGMHLVSAGYAHLRQLTEALKRLGPPALYPNHCTGQAAYVALAQAFGGRVAPCPAGTVLEF